MENEKKLFLLDAYALIYRAYYAFINNPRYNSQKLNTSAMYGFVNTLEDILKNEKPSHIGVVFDPPTKNFRHDLFPEYKANRKPTPEDVKKSIPYVKKIVEAYNIPVVQKDFFEADDVVGTLAKKAEKVGMTVYMMTPDKDYCQLVSENIFVYKPAKGGKKAEIMGLQEVQETYRIEDPLQLIDILALWGDAADNIPGAPGIGEKKSKDMVGKYGSVEGLYEKIHMITGKQKEKLVAAKEQVILSKELATIKLDVDVDFDEETFRYKGMNEPALLELFKELEFQALSRRILQKDFHVVAKGVPVQLSLFDNPEIVRADEVKEVAPEDVKNIENVEHDYKLVDNLAKRRKLIELLGEQTEFCFDTETTSLEVFEAELVGIAFSVKEKEGFYVPIPADRTAAMAIVEEFRAVLENREILKIGQNIKYDIQVLSNYDIRVEGKLFDTMVAHYLVQPEARHNMDFLAEHYLQYKTISIEELIGKKGKGQLTMRAVETSKVVDYAVEDADITLQLKNILSKELEKYDLKGLFEEVEMPLVKVLSDMEQAGVKLNTKALAAYEKELSAELAGIEKDIFELSGEEFNVASPKQLGIVLFEKMKIVDKPTKTKTKQYSTSEKELVKLKEKHPVIEKILTFRSLKKLIGTYVEALPKLVNKKTDRIHTSFNQAVTATGRLSSSNPNLQNIPIRTERGKEIRKTFIASSDEHVLLAADYSQIELRLIAHFSNETNMLEAFKNGEDIHTATASKVFAVEVGDVTREMRSAAKSVNFGIIYGISAFGLSQNSGLSRKEAKTIIDNYFATYPGIKDFMEKSIKAARDNGYVETMMKRRRYLPDIDSRNSIVKGVAERNAVNAPIQGSAADIIKVAMVNVYKKLNESSLKSKMLLQVHDELVLDVPKNELEQVKELIKTEMESAVKLNVDLTVDVGVGENWLDAH